MTVAPSYRFLVLSHDMLLNTIEDYFAKLFFLNSTKYNKKSSGNSVVLSEEPEIVVFVCQI